MTERILMQFLTGMYKMAEKLYLLGCNAVLLNFNGLHGVISQKIELFEVMSVRLFVCDPEPELMISSTL
jgi:hypothetical protein